jgi:hypothetical protein
MRRGFGVQRVVAERAFQQRAVGQHGILTSLLTIRHRPAAAGRTSRWGVGVRDASGDLYAELMRRALLKEENDRESAGDE